MQTQKLIFILNSELINDEINPAVNLLDYIRSHKLTGSKEGCKEGDCGACTVMVGELAGRIVRYRSVNSCLLPLNNVNGKHVVTIEGLNGADTLLNPVQQSFVDEGASQCGFCTPGFIVSAVSYFMSKCNGDNVNIIDAMDGNICRCTGHNSIIRAAEKVVQDVLETHGPGKIEIGSLISKKIIPQYFIDIKNRLEKLKEESSQNRYEGNFDYIVSNGTDLFVQKPDELLDRNILFLENKTTLKEITQSGNTCSVGGLVTVTDLLESKVINSIIPGINRFAELFGSTPIRNSATVGGNINNASPIGDMTALFMALDAKLILTNGSMEREVPLREFYLGYKITVKKANEYCSGLTFKIPDNGFMFNFEKVSKRTYLDIASVNSAILLSAEKNVITHASVSAGGVAPVPLYLKETSSSLINKEINSHTVKRAVEIAQTEISPITDARGAAEYKRLLLSRLIFAHFLTLFPDQIRVEETI